MSKTLCLPMVGRGLPVVSLFVVVAIFTVTFSTAFGRTWNSSDGVYSIEAEFVESEGDKVSLRKPDGKIIQVPLSRLSNEDKAYVAKITATEDKPSSTQAGDPPSKKIQTYMQLVKEARNYCNASDVLRLYKTFINDKDINQEDRKAAESQLSIWEKRAKEKMVRVGKRWLTPSEAADRKKQAQQLVEEAIRLLEVNQYEAAIEKCNKASKFDDDAILADFVLGLVNALSRCDADKANRHFAECVRRDPQHISALNNLALTEVRLGKYQRALAHWQKALEVAPAAPEVIQNLGRFLHLTKRGTLNVPATIQRRYTDLYAESAVSADAKQFNPRKGWLYLEYYSSLGELLPGEAKSGQHDKQSSARLITVGSGTGFVVHPGYILTNRHVVKGCAALSISPPGAKDSELSAVVVAVAKNPKDDLAIVRCDKLKAPPLSFIKSELAPRGTEIMILGFPGMRSRKKPSLKSTRGIIAGLPDESFSEYTLDAIANRGNSGGPICDEAGNVLAILCGATGPAVHLDNNYTLGVPHARALPLLKKHIPGYKQLPPNTTVIKWVDVDALVSRSTVPIWIKMSASHVRIPKAKEKSKGIGVLEDRWCMTCYGRGTVDCPHCRKGRVSVTRTDIVPAPGKPYIVSSTVMVPCKRCNGKGVRDCPHCHGGIDSSLR